MYARFVVWDNETMVCVGGKRRRKRVVGSVIVNKSAAYSMR